MTKYILFILFVSLGLLFHSCKKSESGNSNKPTIAVVLQTLNNPFFVDIKKGIEDEGKKLGIKVIVQAAEREADVEQQMQMVENFIQRNVAAICIAPSSSREIIPAIVKANNAGIPVTIIDVRVDEKALIESGGHILTFIGSDNIQGGRIAGEYVAKQLNYKGNVAILEGTSGVETGDKRLKGFLEAVKKYNGLKIVSSQNANFRRDEGFNVFQNMLQANREIQAVFACNDMMALGAVEAIAAMRRDDIIVVGFDAIEDSRNAIQNNKMSGSIAQYPYEMGQLSIENTYMYLKGEQIKKEIPVKIELITKDNLNKKF